MNTLRQSLKILLIAKSNLFHFQTTMELLPIGMQLKLSQGAQKLTQAILQRHYKRQEISSEKK